jgi:hypothetical protein
LIAALALGAIVWTLSISRRSVAFAFAINWALMGFAFVIWSVVPIRFGAGYYRVHRFERSGALYERLGLRVFQRVLRRSGLQWLRYAPGPGAGATLAAATHGPETAHLVIFIVLSVVTVHAVSRGWWDTAGWLVLFNVLHNAYPVMSLRYVRVRTERLFDGSYRAGG